ncbi:MAG: SemiSWEET transporter [Alphaproteobacteria bacterium]|nr:SemiSWEET transporter [Alphaproteobacteria bacterium]
MTYDVDGVTLLGFAAALMTTLAFLPQAIKVWRSRSTTDISLLTFLTFCIGIVLWLTYGILTQDLPLIAANGATLVLAGAILVFKLRYK